VTHYVVLCCTGAPLAYIDDNRPAGGELTIWAPVGHSQVVIGYEYRRGGG
jgi:hypothetical protein